MIFLFFFIFPDQSQNLFLLCLLCFQSDRSTMASFLPSCFPLPPPTLIVPNNQFRALEWWSVEQFKFYCPSELIRSIRVGAEMKLIAVSQDWAQINKTLNFIMPHKTHAYTQRRIHTPPLVRCWWRRQRILAYKQTYQQHWTRMLTKKQV